MTIRLRNVQMSYILPRGFSEYVTHPFCPARRLESLSDISLDIDEGARLAVFGENGAGKTTLLKLVAGMLFPSFGEVYVNGVNTKTGGPAVRRNIGYVINEERSFYWRLTGLENLVFFASLDNLFGDAALRRINFLVQSVGLAAHAHRRVAEYSAGMKQRLALARGLLTEPRILLLDEPTRSLDPAGTAIMHQFLNELSNCTMIVATNRMEDAAALCDDVVVLRHGKVAARAAIDGNARLETVSAFVCENLAERHVR